MNKTLSASQAAKAAGFINLKQVQEISGECQQTLDNWFKRQPLRFELILLGCKLKLGLVA